MSDGTAKYDWRELRRKTLLEIAEHRGTPINKARLREPKKQKVHMSKSGHPACGMGGWWQNFELSIEGDKVTCSFCKRIVSRNKFPSHH